MFINEPIIALEDIDTEFLSDESVEAMYLMMENEINLYQEEMLSEMNFWVGAAIVGGLLWYNKAALKGLNLINKMLTVFGNGIISFYHKLTGWFRSKYKNLQNYKQIILDSKGSCEIDSNHSYPYDFRKTLNKSTHFNLQAIEGVLNGTKTGGLTNEREIKATLIKGIASKLSISYNDQSAKDLIESYLRGPKITSPIKFSRSDVNYLVYNLQDIDKEADKVQKRIQEIVKKLKEAEAILRNNKDQEIAIQLNAKCLILNEIWTGYEIVKAERYRQALEITNTLQANK